MPSQTAGAGSSESWVRRLAGRKVVIASEDPATADRLLRGVAVEVRGQHRNRRERPQREWSSVCRVDPAAVLCP